MARYLFKQDFVYKQTKNKNGRQFSKTDRVAPRGYYLATKRSQSKTIPNFLYVKKIRGWIKEVYTTAASLKNATETLKIGYERVDKWYSLPHDYQPTDLIRLPNRYCKFRRIEMRKEAAQALIKLIKGAKRRGINIYGFSGFRPFATQRWLYLRRIKRGKKYKQIAVARPGHSEHQLGTTVDVVGDNTALAARTAFAKTRAGKWLRRHCYDFGFVLSYSRDNKIPTGYMYESWHIRYIGKQNIAQWKKEHFRR